MILKDYCYTAAESWKEIKQTTLRNAWNKLRDGHGTLATSVNVDADKDVQEIIDALKFISLCCECSKPYVNGWLESDSHDQGFQLMNVEDIIEFCSKQPAAYEQEQHSDEDEQELVVLPSNNEAFHCLEAALTWFEGQKE
uniref:DDE-1 domain-containing protein n=1 Tax=Trichuris muris TaxID=70415 RepID=A0A5S6Q0T7_TRIMR